MLGLKPLSQRPTPALAHHRWEEGQREQPSSEARTNDVDADDQQPISSVSSIFPVRTPPVAQTPTGDAADIPPTAGGVHVIAIGINGSSHRIAAGSGEPNATPVPRVAAAPISAAKGRLAGTWASGRVLDRFREPWSPQPIFEGIDGASDDQRDDGQEDQGLREHGEVRPPGRAWTADDPHTQTLKTERHVGDRRRRFDRRFGQERVTARR
jgi:hypothetical protein